MKFLYFLSAISHFSVRLWRTTHKLVTMVKETDVIAIIIIILFIVLAAIAFGIYRLVHVARNQGSIESESSTESSEGA